MPEISVIMPVYNKEKYFEAAIYSVLNQPFTDIEVIVVNDGSTDSSHALAKQIAEMISGYTLSMFLMAVFLKPGIWAFLKQKETGYSFLMQMTGWNQIILRKRCRLFSMRR